jgi:predicted MFS family arabinose efflux permease
VRYHQSVYSSVAGFDPDQLSAMPSVHVGWALLVAVAIIGTLRSPWRWLAVLYPVMTTLAVIVTANHFWAEGIVAGMLLALVLAVQAGTRRLVTRVRRRHHGLAGPPEAVPLVVPDHDADAFGDRRREADELAGVDDGAAQ